ncbi:hypothetical protein U8527_07675 [Kordia algicida OT-1]|uniref:Uncharacterized protein n=1 Tax=Kordia algicida OT-1 TaxID=391587 RepID=A9E8L5_9FLAO|nr:hypothetical protein [Kordia algicida]EDP94782.1 hypothetical protein KAOT1_01110 [Kordia algicida OT-1]
MLKKGFKYCFLRVSLLILLSISCVSQNFTKIHLTKEKSEIKGVEYIYKVKDSADLNFINIKYKEDMGRISSVHYTLKEKLPDGRYKVYVNNRLVLNGIMKNNSKEGTWTSVNNLREKQLTPYRNGKIHGVIKEFYKDGSIKRETHVQENKIIFRTTFHKKGKVKTQEQFKNGRCVEIRKFNTKGKQIKANNGL